MYLPSDGPILTQQRADQALNGAQSNQRIDTMQRTSAIGRAKLFNTLVSPSQVAKTLGMGTALNVAKLQSQTDTARASGILGATGGPQGAGESGGGPSPAQIIRDAPEVVSLNRGGGCTTPSYQPVPLGSDPKPGMPHRAPNIVQGPYGLMSYRGADATYTGRYPSVTVATRKPTGLTGYAPRWSDASVMPNGGVESGYDMGVGEWLMDHPWLSLAIAGAGIYALSRRNAR